MMVATMLAQISTAAATQEGALDFTWLFLKMLLALGIVSVLAVLILKYLVPRLGFTQRWQRGGYFTVLGRSILEPKKHLYLVRAGRKYLVIGTAESAIHLITELSSDEVQSVGDSSVVS